jgi:hypothetical protein
MAGGESAADSIAVLCVSMGSNYLQIPGIDCYDKKRDVRTFEGGRRVVAHPPCRLWSAFCAHQAKALKEEKELGPLCVDWLEKCGGVLEHPAHSRLFKYCNLPRHGQKKRGLFTIGVHQSWWGYPMSKATWLCFSGMDIDEIELPFVLHPQGVDRRRQQLMSKDQRSETHPAFAQFLIDCAKKSRGGWL